MRAERLIQNAAALILVCIAPLCASANGVRCHDLFKVSHFQALFTVEADGAKVYKQVEDELKRQDEDPQTAQALDGKMQAFAVKHQGNNVIWEFFREAFAVAYKLEAMAQKPNLLQSLGAIFANAESGAGAMLETSGSREVFVRSNLAMGLIAFSRLMDPQSLQAKRTVNAYLETLVGYKPDTGTWNSNGWGSFLLGIDSLIEARETENKILETAALRLVTDYRLVNQRTRGVTRDQNPTLQAELQGRFAQMSVHFNKTRGELLEIRRQATEAIELSIKPEELNEEIVLGLMSLHLESGRDLKALVVDLTNLQEINREKNFGFVPNQEIWVLRLAQVKPISITLAAQAVKALHDGAFNLSVKAKDPQERTLHGYRSSYEFKMSGKATESILLGLLTYTNLKPSEIIGVAQATLHASVKDPRDYGASDRATAILARLLLVGSGYSSQIRFLVSQAMAGHGTY